MTPAQCRAARALIGKAWRDGADRGGRRGARLIHPLTRVR
jgi:hypothetical protein